MRNTVLPVCIFLFLAIPAFAADKVVVVPLGVTQKAGVPATGQITCYKYGFVWDEEDCLYSYPRGQDGELQNGLPWPAPRFTDNGDGSITDNLTRLVWLQNANCFGATTWSTGLSNVNELAAGYCGLTDGSRAGDWRMPNRNELASLIDAAFYSPALANGAGTEKWVPGDVFLNVQSAGYWTSTSLVAGSGDRAWIVNFYYGRVDFLTKGGGSFVWPVRGGR